MHDVPHGVQKLYIYIIEKIISFKTKHINKYGVKITIYNLNLPHL